MDKYERYCLIRDSKSLKDSDVARLSGIGKSTFSDWKVGRSEPKDDKMSKIAKGLGVTVDFLKGDTDEIECPECGYSYNPLDKFDCACHDNMHNKILEAKSRFQFLIPYNETSKMIAYNLIEIRNNTDKFWDSIRDYIKAEFSKYIYLDYKSEDNFDYDEFCKSVITAMINKGDIPNDKVNDLMECYKIDEEYVNKDSAMLARASKNDQLMRLLKYMEKLSPQSLDSLEIQIKALAEQSKQE